MTEGGVRSAEPSDALWVDTLGRACGLSVDLGAELFRPQGRAWVATPELGFLTAWLVADELQIQDLAVRASARRRGRARALLEIACARAEQEGATVATLELREGNQAALSLYGGAGFEEVGRRLRYYDDGETAVLLTKHLRACASHGGQD